MECTICKQIKQPTKEVKYPCFPCDGCRNLICAECSALSATELRCLPLATRLLKFHCIKCRNYDIAEVLTSQLSDKDQIIKDKNEIILMLQEKLKLFEQQKDKPLPLIQSYADAARNTMLLSNKNETVNNCPKIIIKPKTTQTQQKTKDDLSKNVKPNQLSIGVKWMKSTNSGSLIIKCDNRQDTDKLQQEIKTKMEANYEVELSKMRLPRIKVVNFQQDTDNQDIENCIKKQNNLEDGSITVKYIRKVKSGSATIYLECSPKSFNIIMKQKKIYVGWQRCNVYEDLEVPRCYNCQGFFHKKMNCTNKPVCPNCGEEHTETDCTSEVKCCHNCHTSNDKYKTKHDMHHSTTDLNCPTLIYHINNLKDKTLYTE